MQFWSSTLNIIQKIWKKIWKSIKSSKDENRLEKASVKTAIRVELLTLNSNNSCGIHKSLNKMLPSIFRLKKKWFLLSRMKFPYYKYCMSWYLFGIYFYNMVQNSHTKHLLLSWSWFLREKINWLLYCCTV